MKFWISIGGVLCFFIIGLVISQSSTQFQETSVAIEPHSVRDPAAIRKVYDFSSLEGSALSQASKQRIIAGFQVSKMGDNLGIGLGHFVVRGEDGEKQFACQKYHRVQLSFEGEGIAVAGLKPEMRIEGPCVEGEDINQISPLLVPVARILSQPVADGEFDFNDLHSRVRFSNVSDQWPLSWSLTAVKLINDDNEEVLIEKDEIRAMMNRPMLLELSQFQ
ncbi:MAG: hypothetical protein C5B49_00695 [Bdellovibrio sp.]|nr:MAG: hypothetical protein C5B49_00695 [Bdellovibrio sp.]